MVQFVARLGTIPHQYSPLNLQMAQPQQVMRAGRVYYRVQIRRPSRGVTVDEYFPTKRLAERFLRSVELAIEEGRPVTENVASHETFSAAVEAYLNDPKGMLTANGRPLKPSTIRDRHVRMNCLVRECFSSVQLRRLDWYQIDRVFSERSAALNWSSATRYRYETQLSRFFDYCQAKGWVAANVLKGQQRLNETSARRRIFSDGEWRALLICADKQGGMLSMFLRLAWETGCRKSELLGLRWVDVTFTPDGDLGAEIDILDAKNHEDRRVYASQDCAQRLRLHAREYRRSDSPLIFPSRTRNGRFSVDTPFRRVRTEAGLDKPDEKFNEVLTVHHIRHTWATRLGERGVTLAMLMSAGGWKTAGMAMRYMRRTDALSREAAKLLTGLTNE